MTAGEAVKAQSKLFSVVFQRAVRRNLLRTDLN